MKVVDAPTVLTTGAMEAVVIAEADAVYVSVVEA